METELFIIGTSSKSCTAIHGVLSEQGLKFGEDYEVRAADGDTLRSADGDVVYVLTVHGESKLLTLVGKLSLDLSSMAITRTDFERKSDCVGGVARWTSMVIRA